jgi:integrase
MGAANSTANAQLARTNVRQLDGLWVVDIDDLDGRNVKTAGSVKQLPLHPAIRDDFVKWVRSGTSKRVFPSFVADAEGRYANGISNNFGRLMDRAGLSDPRLVFHSLRHTLKREMSNARIDPDVRRAILGHAPKDAHDAYAGHSLEAIADEFARLPALF